MPDGNNAVAEANAKIAEEVGEWVFKTDQVRLYTVTPFKEAGFGVPSFGARVFTANRPLWNLVHEIGQVQLRVMCDIDARRLAYISINTVKRLGRALNRAFSVLLGREKGPTEERIDGGKGSPVPLPWMCHPVPYFNGDFVRNNWLMQYNELCMFALANAMQHSDNELSLTITEECSRAILVYFQEMKYLLGGELLGLTQDAMKAPTFAFDDAAYAGYATISQRVMSLEDIDAGTDARAGFTEQDLKPLLSGIPSNLILPNLGLYPMTAVDGHKDAKGNMTSAEISPAPQGEAIRPII